MYYVFVTLLAFIPTIIFASDPDKSSTFVPLVGLPYVDDTKELNLASYVNALYQAAIAIAAVLAVIKIIFSGVQYMLTDIVTQKSQAKKSIFNALIGLILIIAAYLILATINEQLVNLNALDAIGEGFEVKTKVEVTEETVGSICVNDLGQANPTDCTLEKAGLLDCSSSEQRVIKNNEIYCVVPNDTGQGNKSLAVTNSPKLAEEIGYENYQEGELVEACGANCISEIEPCVNGRSLPKVDNRKVYGSYTYYQSPQGDPYSICTPNYIREVELECAFYQFASTCKEYEAECSDLGFTYKEGWCVQCLQGQTFNTEEKKCM